MALNILEPPRTIARGDSIILLEESIEYSYAPFLETLTSPRLTNTYRAYNYLINGYFSSIFNIYYWVGDYFLFM